MFFSHKRIKDLYVVASHIRQDVIVMLEKAESGHSAGPLGMADVFAALYFGVLNHKPKQPEWVDRDRVVLSNGHICPALYATLARAGYIPLKELSTLRKMGSGLQGHPHRKSLPGIEITSGPLGEGLSQAIGMTLAAKLDEKKYRVYCVLSDGELQEGNIWEAFMFAGKNRLHNLTVIIDRNNIQIGGYTEDIMPVEPLRDKLHAFGWNVLDVDGHNIEDIIDALYEARAVYEKPTVIVAHTIAGKGVDFMENKFEWHGKPPKKEEAKKALRELRSLQGKIHSEHE